jgi:Spy/CpxP family protein refolding chaperone
MFKRVLILSFASVFFIAASSVFAKMMESSKPKLTTREQRAGKIQARVIALNKKLNLSDQQRKQITEILARVKEDTVKMLEETGERIGELKAKGEEEIAKVLTEQQKEKFNNVHEEETDEDVVKVFKTSY